MSQFIQSSMDWYVKRSQRTNDGQLAVASRNSTADVERRRHIAEPLTGFGLQRTEQQVQKQQKQPLLQARKFSSRNAPGPPTTELKRTLSTTSRGPHSHTDHQPKLAAIANRSRSATSQPPQPTPSPSPSPAFNALITGTIAQLLRWRTEQPLQLFAAPLCETHGRVVRHSTNGTVQVLLLRDDTHTDRGPVLQATYHAIDRRLPAEVACAGALVRCVGRFQLGGRFQAYKVRRLRETSGAELIARLASLTQHERSAGVGNAKG